MWAEEGNNLFQKNMEKKLAYKCWYTKVAGIDYLVLFFKYLFLPYSLDKNSSSVYYTIN